MFISGKALSLAWHDRVDEHRELETEFLATYIPWLKNVFYLPAVVISLTKAELSPRKSHSCYGRSSHFYYLISLIKHLLNLVNFSRREKLVMMIHFHATACTASRLQQYSYVLSPGSTRSWLITTGYTWKLGIAIIAVICEPFIWWKKKIVLDLVLTLVLRNVNVHTGYTVCDCGDKTQFQHPFLSQWPQNLSIFDYWIFSLLAIYDVLYSLTIPSTTC